jgi:uncharacterized repeat protein (TIGR03803 family)
MGSTQNHSVRARFRVGVIAASMLFSVLAPGAAQAQTLTLLHDFTGGLDGSGPQGLVAVDRGGNVYGSASYGGNRGGICAGIGGCGAVFRASNRNGAWQLDPIYTFHGDDGGGPQAGVTLGPDGAIYGTTLYGGGNQCGMSCGVVFKLTPPASFCRMVLCPWTETVLYRADGSGPGSFVGGVTVDSAGNVYGMAAGGGSGNNGVVYKLTPTGGNNYTFSVLYNFTGGADGAAPLGNVTFDSAGNLYGTATFGGANDDGTVFKLVRSAGGYSFQLLYTFTGHSDGELPQGNVVLDSAGNLYGATGELGGVFQITPSGVFTVIDRMGSTESPITIDAAGNLYGTTYAGGSRGDGSLFEDTYSNGSWTHNVLYSFGAFGGALPLSGVGFDSSGNLYGTTTYGGGQNAGGTLWEFTP